MSMIEQELILVGFHVKLKHLDRGEHDVSFKFEIFLYLTKKIYATIILLLLLCLVDVVSQKKYRLAKTRFRASLIYSKLIF